MAETNLPGDQYPEEVTEAQGEETQRRAASARFEVDAKVGSEALMRGAMDPANQSMAEALRLSYRVLQMVILVLIVLFFVSSVQTVDDDQGGVLTRWGAIQETNGDPNLSPGLKWGVLPYPISEFILFNVTNRSADVGNAFVQSNPGGNTLEEQLNAATADKALIPNVDGSLLTRDGDVVHMRVAARYNIDPASRFVERINDADPAASAARIVRMALQQATVHAVAGMASQDVVDRAAEVESLVQQAAQRTLDQLQCGITLAQVDVTNNSLPFSIQKVNGDLQQAQLDAQSMVETARAKAEESLIRTAGNSYRDIVKLIDQYEEADELADKSQATDVLAKINETLERQDVLGDVANVLSTARTYQSQIESGLGGEVQRFQSLRAAYEDNPELVIRKQWMEAYAYVLSRPDVETIYVPYALGTAQILVNGSSNVQQLRQQMAIAAKERRNMQQFMNVNDLFIKRGSDISIGEAGRQLNRGDDGKVKSLNAPPNP